MLATGRLYALHGTVSCCFGQGPHPENQTVQHRLPFALLVSGDRNPIRKRGLLQIVRAGNRRTNRPTLSKLLVLAAVYVIP